MVSPTLYTIGEEFIALERILEEQPDGATEADLDTVAHWLEELHGKLEEKLSRCIAYIREQEALSEARLAEAQRLRESAAVPANRVKRLKEAIRFVFETQGLKKIETALGNVTLAGNGGKAPLEVLVPVDQLPDDCKRVVVEPDLDAIRAVLAKGESVTFARALPRGNHIRIK